MKFSLVDYRKTAPTFRVPMRVGYFTSQITKGGPQPRSGPRCCLLWIHTIYYTLTDRVFFSRLIFYMASLNMLTIADSEEVEWEPSSFLVALITEWPICTLLRSADANDTEKTVSTWNCSQQGTHKNTSWFLEGDIPVECTNIFYGALSNILWVLRALSISLTSTQSRCLHSTTGITEMLRHLIKKLKKHECFLKIQPALDSW